MRFVSGCVFFTLRYATGFRRGSERRPRLDERGATSPMRNRVQFRAAGAGACSG